MSEALFDLKWSLAVQTRAQAVKLVALDVDGVLTDGGLWFNDVGQEMKRFFVRDGMGIRLLLESGITVGCITARHSDVVTCRSRELGLSFLHQGVHDKWACLQQELAQRGLDASQCAYMGDDLIDLPVLIRVGLACAPVDADLEVRSRVHWVASKSSGAGAVRELAEGILKIQGNWQQLMARWIGSG
ncbi:MAG: phenylphosphate carboxylase subunit delta [Magnetococcus sp. DMHC-6]